MKLTQLILRYWKEYKHLNTCFKLDINKNVLFNINKQYVEGKSSIIYLLNDISLLFILSMESLNLNKLLTEKRTIRHNLNWILKNIFQKEVEKEKIWNKNI